MLSMELFHHEVHLLIPGDVGAELDAGALGEGAEGDGAGDNAPGLRQGGDPPLEQAGLGLQLLDLGLDQGLLLAQQRQGVVHGLPFQIVFDLLHGKIQPAQVPDDVELVHVLQII